MGSNSTGDSPGLSRISFFREGEGVGLTSPGDTPEPSRIYFFVRENEWGQTPPGTSRAISSVFSVKGKLWDQTLLGTAKGFIEFIFP